MNLFISLYLAALFVAFTPGVLVTLPPKGSKYVVLATHAVLFALVWHYTHKTVWRMTAEGFQDNTDYNTSSYNNSANNSYNNSGNNPNYTAEGFQKGKKM